MPENLKRVPFCLRQGTNPGDNPRPSRNERMSDTAKIGSGTPGLSGLDETRCATGPTEHYTDCQSAYSQAHEAGVLLLLANS